MKTINTPINEKEIGLNQIEFLSRNPRFGYIEKQEDILNFFLTDKKDNYGKKVLNLAKDIAQKGLNPTDLPMVMQKSEDTYIVYEGNRRISALKALSNPELIKDETIKNEYQKLSEEKEFKDIQIRCYVALEEKTAFDIMNKKHGGELEGVGTSSWNVLEKDRFKSLYEGKDSLIVILYDYIEKNKLFEGNLQKEIPVSVLNRILPDIKLKFNLTVLDGKLVTTLKGKVLKEKLSQVLVELKSQDTRTLNKESDKKNFFDKLEEKKQLPTKKDFNKTPKAFDIEPVPSSPLEENYTKEVSQTKTQPQKKLKDMGYFLPAGFELNIPQTEQRIRTIFNELVSHSKNEFVESFAILTRVFLEMSIDYYGDANISGFSNKRDKNKGNGKKYELGARLNDVFTSLKNDVKLESRYVKPTHSQISKECFNYKTLSDYVHNPKHFLDEKELKTFWHNMQYFFKAIWS